MPSSWRNLPSALRHIPISDDDVFLDLGSGKGRVVLQAAKQPLNRVIGVELSSELHAVAQENLQAVHTKLRCQDVELLQADITTYRIPDDVSVVYAYNPVRGGGLRPLPAAPNRHDLAPPALVDARHRDQHLGGKTRIRLPVLIPCNIRAA